MRFNYYRIGVLLPVVAALVAGCVFSPKRTNGGGTVNTYPPQDSPANCLACLQLAYMDRNLDQYIQLFAEDFTFVFAAVDVHASQNPTPPTWPLADERSSADNMFHRDTVKKITLSFAEDAAIDSNQEHENTWKINVTNVNLRVDTIQEDGTPLALKVASGKATFYFKEYPSEHASNGRALWRIWQWEDQPMGAALAAKGPLTAATRAS